MAMSLCHLWSQLKPLGSYKHKCSALDANSTRDFRTAQWDRKGQEMQTVQGRTQSSLCRALFGGGSCPDLTFCFSWLRFLPWCHRQQSRFNLPLLNTPDWKVFLPPLLWENVAFSGSRGNASHPAPQSSPGIQVQRKQNGAPLTDFTYLLSRQPSLSSANHFLCYSFTLLISRTQEFPLEFIISFLLLHLGYKVVLSNPKCKWWVFFFFFWVITLQA